MNNPQWKDLRKEKPHFLQDVVLRHEKDHGVFVTRVARYTPFRSTTTGRLVPVFVDRACNIAISGHEWYPIPQDYSL